MIRNLDYTKLMAINITALGISMAEVNHVLQAIIVILSIVLSIVKLLKSRNDKDKN